MSAKRAEKAPFTSERIAPGGAQRTAASMSPVAEAGQMNTGREVRNTTRSIA
jgi:hypothetical protein